MFQWISIRKCYMNYVWVAIANLNILNPSSFRDDWTSWVFSLEIHFFSERRLKWGAGCVCAGLKLLSRGLATWTSICLIKLKALEQPSEISSFNHSALHLSSKSVLSGYHVSGSALGPGDAFKLNVSDVTSRNENSLAHILSGTILMVLLIFIRELNEQNFAK